MVRMKRMLKVAAAAAVLSFAVASIVAPYWSRKIVSDLNYGGGRKFPWAEGVILAHLDQLRWHDEIKGFGLPASSSDGYGSLLKGRHGVTTSWVAGCSVSTDLIEFVDGYNSVASFYIWLKHFGDIFSDGAADAERIHKEKSNAAQRPGVGST